MTMVFRNFGGLYQLVVRDEKNLAGIDRLDPARWAATSAPVADLRCEPAFLAYVDAEGKGRILHPTRTGPELGPSAPGAPSVGAPSGWGPRIRVSQVIAPATGSSST